MLADSGGDDCTGCWSAVRAATGWPVAEIPVLPAMSAIARQTRS
jgi:hypothetical protein